MGVGGIETCESTLRRTLNQFDANVFDSIVNTSVMVQFGTVGNCRIIAADGKNRPRSCLRRRARPDVLSGMGQDSSVVIGQVEVGAKTNEIPMLTALSIRSTSPTTWSLSMRCTPRKQPRTTSSDVAHTS